MYNNNVLTIRTFGGFSLSWNGRILNSGTKSDDTQLVRIIQMILHNRENGVERSMLMELLDEDSTAEDVHHLLRSVLYNARKKLRAAGLPESSYIEFKHGRYFWTSDIPVIEDARQFEELCNKAEQESDPSAKKQIYKEACYMYKGEFLPHQTRLMWVTEENRRYNQMFKTCVDFCADNLRANHDYHGLKQLGRHASKVSPFNEWEILTMEALINLGRYNDAHELYTSCVEMYQKELGVKLSHNMISKMEELSIGLDHICAKQDVIYDLLSEDSDKDGGFYCSYPVFRGIFRMLKRASGRCVDSAYLMICNVISNEENNIHAGVLRDGNEMDAVSEQIRKVIDESVRKEDIVCRFAKDQFLILLLNSSEDECRLIKDRINDNVRKSGINIRLDYDLSLMDGSHN